MSNTYQTVQKVISNIQEQNNYPKIEIKEDTRIVYDLGFKSLDIAQLIGMLELELEVDPFAEGASIASIKTVRNLSDIYDEKIK